MLVVVVVVWEAGMVKHCFAAAAVVSPVLVCDPHSTTYGLVSVCLKCFHL